MKIFKFLIMGLMLNYMLGCKPKSEKQTTAIKTDITETKAEPPVVTPTPIIQQQAKMTFVAYNDDGDYNQLIAKKGDSTIYFVNDDDDRSLNRGDIVEVHWKKDMITMPGDDESPTPADRLTSIKKLADGPVTKFKKAYGKQLKYTWAPEENYSGYHLDKVYRLVEFYIASSKNELLQDAIKRKEAITYSVESQKRNDREYTAVGIAVPGANGNTIVQWLYIDDENSRLYEYDLGNDELVAFK